MAQKRLVFGQFEQKESALHKHTNATFLK